MADVLIGEVLCDTSITNRMIEEVARKSECSCDLNGHVGASHTGFVPVGEPRSQALFDLAALMKLPKSNSIPHSEKRYVPET